MATLSTKIKMYVKANGKVWQDEKKNYVLVNNGDGAGDIIESWNVIGLAQPTVEQLATYEDEGNTFEANVLVIQNRKKSYGSWGDQLDEIYKNIDAWKTRIKSIKDSNPKS
jgi:hypothetical protein